MKKIIMILVSIMILIATTAIGQNHDIDYRYYDEEGMFIDGERYRAEDTDQYSAKIFNESDQLVGVLNYDDRNNKSSMGVITHGSPDGNKGRGLTATHMASFEAGTVDTRHYLQRYYTRKDGYEILVQFWHYKSTPPSIKYGVNDPTKPRIYDVRIGITNHNLTVNFNIKTVGFYVINKGNFTWAQWQEIETALKHEYGSKPGIYYKDNGPYISSW